MVWAFEFVCNDVMLRKWLERCDVILFVDLIVVKLILHTDDTLCDEHYVHTV